MLGLNMVCIGCMAGALPWTVTGVGAGFGAEVGLRTGLGLGIWLGLGLGIRLSLGLEPTGLWLLKGIQPRL